MVPQGTTVSGRDTPAVDPAVDPGVVLTKAVVRA
jgi:hypothetical protein